MLLSLFSAAEAAERDGGSGGADGKYAAHATKIVNMMAQWNHNKLTICRWNMRKSRSFAKPMTLFALEDSKSNERSLVVGNGMIAQWVR